MENAIKSQVWGGYGTPYNIPLTLTIGSTYTATDDGVANIFANPSSSATGFIYIKAKNENGENKGYAAVVLALSGAIATNAFVVKKGWTYTVENCNGLNQLTVTMYPLE